jgi:hypothetical protein
MQTVRLAHVLLVLLLPSAAHLLAGSPSVHAPARPGHTAHVTVRPVGPAHAAFAAALRAPRPPAAARTFVWTVRGLTKRAAQDGVAIYLAGCWSAREVTRTEVHTTKRQRAPRVRT